MSITVIGRKRENALMPNERGSPPRSSALPIACGPTAPLPLRHRRTGVSQHDVMRRVGRHTRRPPGSGRECRRFPVQRHRALVAHCSLRALPCSGAPLSDRGSIGSSAAWAAVQFNRAFLPSGQHGAATAPRGAVGRTAEKPLNVTVNPAAAPGCHECNDDAGKGARASASEHTGRWGRPCASRDRAARAERLSKTRALVCRGRRA